MELLSVAGKSSDPGRALYFGRAELHSCIRRDQNVMFDSIEYDGFTLGRPKLLDLTGSVA